jgi:hypothetical protein
MSRIGNLETESIGYTLRQYAVEVARRAGTLGNPDEIAARLKDTYNVRSRLLHDGVADVDKIRTTWGSCGISFLSFSVFCFWRQPAAGR